MEVNLAKNSRNSLNFFLYRELTAQIVQVFSGTENSFITTNNEIVSSSAKHSLYQKFIFKIKSGLESN